MTEEERDPELVRLRSKLADAIDTLNAISDTDEEWTEYVKDTHYTDEEFERAVDALTDLANARVRPDVYGSNKGGN